MIKPNKKQDKKILKEVGTILKQTLENLDQSKKKRFKISVLKFRDKKNNHDKMRDTEITVYATDEVEAIQMHNEIFNNYKDVENYLIIGNGKITEALQNKGVNNA